MDCGSPDKIDEKERIQQNQAVLKERLGKAHVGMDKLGNNPESKYSAVDSKVPQKYKRKLGSWIFENVGGFYLPTENVSQLSVNVQEEILIRDLIYAFSGVPSSHIRPDISVESIPSLRTEHIDQLRFTIDESFSGAFRTLANELLPMIGYYINVQSFIEDTILTTSGARALGIALHKNMQNYFDVQSALENQLLEHKLSLQQLVQQMRPWLTTLEAYASLTTQARNSELTSAQLLSLMHEHQQRYKSDDLKELLCEVSRYYMKIVQLWTQKGVLYDMRGEFYVQDTCANDMSSTLLSPKQCCYEYWAQRYRLHMDRLPSFLEPLADKIFLAGKYLNVLRQCNVHMKLMQAPLTYMPEDEAHVETLTSSYELSAHKLLLVLQQDKVQQHLKNLQDYFLFQNEDFVKSLMAKCSGQMKYCMNDLIPEKLQKLLHESLLGNADPFKHLVRLQLKHYDVTALLASKLKRQKPKDSTFGEQEASSEAEASSDLPDEITLMGYEVFAITYEAKWPISLVIHKAPLQQLQCLFRVLFYMRYVQYQLSVIPYQDPSTSPSRTTQVRQRMSDCIQQLEQYMTVDIVQPRWQTLLLAAEKAKHIDDLIHAFQYTLDECQQLCLLSEPVIFVRSLFTLGQMCINFCRDIGESEVQVLDSSLDEYEQEFNSLLISILDLVSELANPGTSGCNDANLSCIQLLKRFPDFNKDTTEQT